jgi:hypothetical protein
MITIIGGFGGQPASSISAFPDRRLGAGGLT